MYTDSITNPLQKLNKSLFLYKSLASAQSSQAAKYFPLVFQWLSKVSWDRAQIGTIKEIYDEIFAVSSSFIQYNSALDHIYHCCTHKSGSQWLKQIFSDFRVFQYSGLLPLSETTIDSLIPSYDSFDLTQIFVPTKTIITGAFHLQYEEFIRLSIRLGNRYRAFFVIRDPRDILVSHYFSLKYSHSLFGSVGKHREVLNNLSTTKGLLYLIDQDQYIFDEIKSWVDAYNSGQNTNIILVYFEDLIGSKQLEHVQKLFRHCDINLPNDSLEQLLADYNFERLSGGRQLGEENHRSHYRKGTPGDWRNYFNQEIADKFYTITGSLVHDLGYSA
jgi:hypothetical protein